MLQERIDIVNKLIIEIASLGRNFFKYNDRIAYIEYRNNRLYMLSEYHNEMMCIDTKHNFQPRKWTHGGTLWGLTRDFKEFIRTGVVSDGNNGYGGLKCPHWGYSTEDMKTIYKKAKELGYV